MPGRLNRNRVRELRRGASGRRQDIPGRESRYRLCSGLCVALLLALAASLGPACSSAAKPIDVPSLLEEMVDFENLARIPQPFYRQASASSYSRESRRGGDAWFDNRDVGQYIRTETNGGRTEDVLADLKGPGAVTRLWSANPTLDRTVRFYFNGEKEPRLEVPLRALFDASVPPFGPDFSYISGTGGNLYYPLPYAESLKITVEETDGPLRLYYQVGYRSYDSGTRVRTFDPREAEGWRDIQARVARALARPAAAASPRTARWINARATVAPGETRSLPAFQGPQAVYEWSVRVLGTREDGPWDDPERAHNACRSLLLEVRFDGERSIATPLGDFFGSAPGLNPYENLFFTVDATGRMTSRLLMPFDRSMELSLTNAGRIPYDVEISLRVGRRAFGDRDGHLRAQWGALTRDSWPFFDTNVLTTTGSGKVVGTVYEIANPVLIWWGEGDQKIFVDGEAFPSTFGTGTEDDYGFAYGYNGPFARPYHAQTRVDGPASGGHISLNRCYVLDSLPYRAGIRFDQEMWHWMPCRPTWNQVVYWYARPGSPGPRSVGRTALAPVDLGIRENMLEPIEGEDLRHEQTGGAAERQRLANCSGAEHLVWHDGRPGDRLTVHFTVLRAGRYSVELNLCQSPEYGRCRLKVDGRAVPGTIDGYAPRLYWLHPKLGVFNLREGDNTLAVEALAPNPESKSSKNQFGLDYIFLTRREESN
jgi:hypothetical protein